MLNYLITFLIFIIVLFPGQFKPHDNGFAASNPSGYVIPLPGGYHDLSPSGIADHSITMPTSVNTNYRSKLGASAGFVWGRDGHAITAEIARTYFTESTSREVEKLLGDMTLAEASVWLDQVRPSPEYAHTRDWHWVTIPTGQTYEESEKNPNGDVVQALETNIRLMKQGNLNDDRMREALKVIIHLIGDIHQPLHVGTGDDRGGNDVRISWFGRNTNLHSLWDTGMIVSFQLSVDQWVTAINLPTPEEVWRWQNSTVRDWAHESMKYRDEIYNLPDNMNPGWDYRNRNFHIVEKRLLQAGVRMAGVLNEIFAEPEGIDEDS